MTARRFVSLVLCAVPVVLVTVLGWRQRWISDDGFINLRVVEQVLSGHGPVFNIGERVEVTTSTLWLWMLVAGQAVAPSVESGVVAVVLGVVLTGYGVAIGIDAARRLWPFSGVVAPVGAVALVALPPVWDFATSGLETGLSFAWLGTSQWLLVRALVGGPSNAGRVAAVVIGLGPLVRPDLALVAGCLGLALVLQRPRRGALTRQLRRTLALAGLALALPLAWQVFRAGYYGSLVPNTALAKGFADGDAGRGWTYLVDYLPRYALWFPLVVAVGIVVWLAISSTARVAAAAPVVGGLLHAGYVVHLGGDFMHARMFLPATMAILLPAFAVAIPYGRSTGGRPVRHREPRSTTVLLAGLVAGMLVWAGPVAAVRTPYQVHADPTTGIANERSYYLVRSASHRLVLVADLRGIDLDTLGRRLRADRAAGLSYYFEGNWRTMAEDGHHEPAVPGRVAIAQSSLGIVGVVGGREVFVADTVGLADPVGARIVWPDDAPDGSRTGHRERPQAWRLARYAAPQPDDPAEVLAAREALRCGDLAELQAAVTAPLTPERFLANLAAAPRLTALDVPADPTVAQARFCQPVR